MKKKRAATEDVARIALEDLSKYFNLPIVEASKNLKVGLTVLKRKCREFGIPRWPHRKIKSLDSLIRDLQVLSLLSNFILLSFTALRLFEFFVYAIFMDSNKIRHASLMWFIIHVILLPTNIVCYYKI